MSAPLGVVTVTMRGSEGSSQQVQEVVGASLALGVSLEASDTSAAAENESEESDNCSNETGHFKTSLRGPVCAGRSEGKAGT